MRTDILVVGGGLAGTAIAYYLARGGADVLLIERTEINALASGANSGSIHAQIPLEPFLEQGEAWTRGFAPTIPLMIASIGLWSGLEAELGADLELALPGGLMVAEDERQLRVLERKAAVERAHGLPVEILSPADLAESPPASPRTWPAPPSARSRARPTRSGWRPPSPARPSGWAPGSAAASSCMACVRRPRAFSPPPAP